MVDFVVKVVAAGEVVATLDDVTFHEEVRADG